MVAKVTKRFEVALDLADPGANRQFSVVEGDTGNELSILITDGGYPVDLTGCRVIAVFSKSNGTSCQDSGAEEGGILICGALNNQVDIQLYPPSVAPGMVECELQIYSDQQLTTLVTTAKFNFACRKAIMDGETVASAPQYPILSRLIKRVEELESASSAAAEAANAAAGNCRDAVEGKLSAFEIIRYAQDDGGEGEA